MSNKLYKPFFDANRQPEICLKRMSDGGFEYATWESEWTNIRYIAKKSYFEKIFKNKRYKEEIGEVLELGACLTVDEHIFEMDANNVNELEIQDGLRNTKKIHRHELNLISEVLYNPDFDCEKLWETNS